MKDIRCPHCKEHHLPAKDVPADAVVFMLCPGCHELVVLFKRKAAALDRDVLRSGTDEEQIAHIAQVIHRFWRPGMLRRLIKDQMGAVLEGGEESNGPKRRRKKDAPETPPISQAEVDRFVQFDLGRLDDHAYFRKHFGEEE